MQRRLPITVIPLLGLLILAWGTCPCLYADVLTGGSPTTYSAGGCGCCEQAGDVGAGEGRSPRESDVRGRTPPQPKRCPCIDTIGTKHALPQVERAVPGSDARPCGTPSPEAALAPLPSEASARREAPSGTDPGALRRSVVRVV